MPITLSGVAAHDTACAKFEAVRQSMTAAIAQPNSTFLAIGAAGVLTLVLLQQQQAQRAADVAFYRACLASANANGVNPHQFIVALQELGTGGQ
jgi:hypothetical protein